MRRYSSFMLRIFSVVFFLLLFLLFVFSLGKKKQRKQTEKKGAKKEVVETIDDAINKMQRSGRRTFLMCHLKFHIYVCELLLRNKVYVVYVVSTPLRSVYTWNGRARFTLKCAWK